MSQILIQLRKRIKLLTQPINSYHQWCVCKHTIALAITHNLKLKGFQLKQTLTVNKKKGRQARVGPALSHDDDDDDDVSGKPPAAPRKVRPYFKKN